MRDRLRELIDLVLASLDEDGADGRALAGRAHFSRDHFDRLLAGALGETPVGFRRRLLLERAAWQLRAGAASPTEAAAAAGYGSLEAFSRAFARAHGVPPSAFAASGRPWLLEAHNGIHFHAPAGLVLPGGASTRPGWGVDERLVGHHLDRARELLAAARTVDPALLTEVRRPGWVAVWFEGDEATAALMLERLVGTLEVWVAAIAGEDQPDRPPADLDELARAFEHVAARWTAIVDDLRARGAWDDAFVDALCEPPQSFTYGGVAAHVLHYGAIRCAALAHLLAELGATGISDGDPIVWEAAR